MRNAVQNGTPLTLYGYHVGHIMVKEPNSDGAALLPLPQPQMKSAENAEPIKNPKSESSGNPAKTGSAPKEGGKEPVCAV